MAASISTFLLLGASGDLASRLLLPALGQLLAVHERHRVELVGAGSERFEVDQWRERVRASLTAAGASGPAIDELARSARYLTTDVTDVGELRALLSECRGRPAIYFALPPAVTVRACAALQHVDLPEGTVLALEKPFGADRNSARALNGLLADLVSEDRVHRVDHFLGRSTVHNLLGFRFANRIFEPVWNAEHIERVDIVYDEQLALEGRARYYDRAGALVDMIQSHLLQVLALVAMEPPATLDAADLRDAKGLVLRATRVYGGDAQVASRRARYTEGRVGERDVVAYLDEPGVDPGNDTETLAEVTLEVNTWRWAGVPFRLRSGKALGRRRREVAITFKNAPRVPAGLRGRALPTMLRIFLAPDQMRLEVNMNGPGDPATLNRVALEAEFGPGRLSAYGEVLEGILDDDPALSVRADTAEECWRIVEPVLAAWRTGPVPMDEYAAGSEGPAGWTQTRK